MTSGGFWLRCCNFALEINTSNMSNFTLLQFSALSCRPISNRCCSSRQLGKLDCFSLLWVTSMPPHRVAATRFKALSQSYLMVLKLATGVSCPQELISRAKEGLISPNGFLDLQLCTIDPNEISTYTFVDSGLLVAGGVLLDVIVPTLWCLNIQFFQTLFAQHLQPCIHYVPTALLPEISNLVSIPDSAVISYELVGIYFVSSFTTLDRVLGFLAILSNAAFVFLLFEYNCRLPLEFDQAI
eukprot:Gb_29120 [translate_table: standard]